MDSWLRFRIGGAGDLRDDLRGLSRTAAAAGVTGFTDATPELDNAAVTVFATAQTEGTLLQRLHLLSPIHGEAIAAVGTRSAEGMTIGAAKLMLDDDRLPPFEQFVADIRRAHRSSVPVAVHCVTRTQAAFTVAALEEAGAETGDRIEHGAVLGTDLFPTLRSLGLTIVTQPGFVFARGDRYREDVDADDLDDLWRLGSLLAAGIPVVLSTDAPFGPEDPWQAVRTAAARRTRGGRALGEAERIEPARALSLFLGEASRPSVVRSIAPGSPADLVVLCGTLDDALHSPGAEVAATVVEGRLVHGADAR